MSDDVLDDEMAFMRQIQAQLDKAMDVSTEAPPEELTVEVAVGWLDTGPPTEDEMLSRFGLGRHRSRWELLDRLEDRHLSPSIIDQMLRDRYIENASRVSFSIINQMLRDRYIENVSYALPSAEAVALIAAHGPILEVGAGTGFWSALIARGGADVIATDLHGWEGAEECGWYGRHFPVQRMEATEAVERHPDRTVLMCWPSRSDWGAAAVDAMAVGAVLCHIGEIGGCTGNERLSAIMARDFDVIGGCAIPVWPMIHDDLTILRRHRLGPRNGRREDRRRRKRRLRKDEANS